MVVQRTQSFIIREHRLSGRQSVAWERGGAIELVCGVLGLWREATFGDAAA